MAEIWLAGAAAAPMRRVPAVEAVAGLGLAGDRYALGGGTWAQYPDLEKQVTLIDAGTTSPRWPRRPASDLTPGDTRRNLVTDGHRPARRWSGGGSPSATCCCSG